MCNSIHNDSSPDSQYYETVDLDRYFDIDKYWDIDNYLNNEVSPALDQGDDRENEMINYITKTKERSACQYWRSLCLFVSV